MPYKALYGLIRPYPSLSFGEYNSSSSRLFSPLAYFLAGRYLDPWDAGEGDPKNWSIFVFLLAILASKIAPKLVQKLLIFGSIFESLFWGFGALWVPLGSLLGPLEALLGGLWTQKRVKTKRFLRVLKRQFFGLWSSWWPSVFILAASWANLVPRWGSKMGVKSAAERYQKMGFICLIKINNKPFWFNFWFVFGLVLGPIFEAHFGTQNWFKIC